MNCPTDPGIKVKDIMKEYEIPGMMTKQRKPPEYTANSLKAK